MLERADQIDGFLEAMGWNNATRTMVAGDMSARKYTRLSLDGKAAILMDADSSQASFVKMTIWLGALGLSVPRIVGAKAEEGLLLLEDLGETSLKAVCLSTPELEKPLFRDCIDVLLRIRKGDPPALPCPSAKELVDWTRLADDHYPGIETNALFGFRAVLQDALEDALFREPSVSLRDFHTENIMWLPKRQGCRRYGLLDYQDAFLTHPVYDLVSLLTDARKYVPADLREDMILAYLERSGDNAEGFQKAFAAFSAQRNLRILGIFSRAGKHVSLLPNVYNYFVDALQHPMFDSVRTNVLDAVKPPKGVST